MADVPPYYERSLRFVSGFTGSYRLTGAIGRILNWRHGFPITMFVNRSMRDPELIAQGLVDFHWFIPVYTADWALHGTAEFAGRAAPNLRGVAVFPQDDFMLFAVAPHVEVESVGEICSRRLPLRIGLRGATYFVEELLRECGASAEAIESWGGHLGLGREELGTSVSVGRWCTQHLDAVFGEAATQPIWRALAAAGWRFLPIEADTLQGLQARLGLRTTAMPVGFLPGVNRPLPTIDQSNFQLACRAELPEETVYLVARVIDENREPIQNATVGVSLAYTEPLPIAHQELASPLTGPIERQWEGGSIPLHPGAERYYREKGVLGGGAREAMPQ